MLPRILVILFLLTAFSASTFAQSKKKKKKRSLKNTEQVSQPTALNPALPTKDYAPKAKKKTKGATYESEQQFYERMAQLEKTKRKNERLMEKPQYSDPSYFGHKRPPKKNKRGKLKFCKECGIRH
jgi:hypothetical protein